MKVLLPTGQKRSCQEVAKQSLVCCSMGKTCKLSAIENYELRGLGYIHESFEIILKIKGKSR